MTFPCNFVFQPKVALMETPLIWMLNGPNLLTIPSCMNTALIVSRDASRN